MRRHYDKYRADARDACTIGKNSWLKKQTRATTAKMRGNVGFTAMAFF